MRDRRRCRRDRIENVSRSSRAAAADVSTTARIRMASTVSGSPNARDLLGFDAHLFWHPPDRRTDAMAALRSLLATAGTMRRSRCRYEIDDDEHSGSGPDYRPHREEGGHELSVHAISEELRVRWQPDRRPRPRSPRDQEHRPKRRRGRAHSARHRRSLPIPVISSGGQATRKRNWRATRATSMP